MLLKKNPLEIHLFKCFSYILVFSLTIINCTYSQYLSGSITKKGGVCFRTDDNQQISRYLEYAALFSSYNQKFTLAVNLGLSNEITPEYIVGLKQIQASGHEIMDHTPNHRTNYFTTILPTDYYINHPGVQRIAGNKIELKYVNVNIANAKRSGYVNISRDTITSTSGIFSSFSKSDCYLYFPSLGQLVFIDEVFGWIDQNRVKVTDFWRNGIDLGTRQNIQFYNFDFNNVHLTVDGLKALGEESIRLANYYGLERPYSWIQPGGYFPHVYKNEVKQACGDALGYKSAGIFADPSLKVFNEYDPGNDEQYGMSFGDFRDDIWTLEQCKGYIADRLAKHWVVFGGNHFTNGEDGLLGGWQGFLTRTVGLIQWCIANNIPIKTYSEWADILYNQIPDPNENIFPQLNVDLDANNVPDGYNWEPGILKKTDGVPAINDYCYSITSAGNICSMRELAGIEKGTNEFEIWTKGAPGDFIEVNFKVGSQNLVYKFPAENSGWTKYKLAQSINGNTSLNIPANISFIDVTIRCSNYSSGEVKISGMKLARSLVEYLSVTPTDLSVPYGSGSTTFTVTSNANWTVSDDAGWISVSPGSGSGNGTITVTYSANPNTYQRSGSITVTGGGITGTVAVTQAQQPFALSITPSERNVEDTEGNTTFTIISNTDWTVNDDAEWLTVSPGSGSGNGTITVMYSANPNTSQRSGTVTVTGGGITCTVAITQAQQPFALSITPSERSVEDTEGNTTFTIISNTDWTVNDNAEWLTVSPEGGSGNGTITVTYSANPNTYQRSGSITVTGGGITCTVAITQAQQPFALSITPSERSVEDTEGNTTFTIISNTDWTVNDNAEWLTVSPESGSGNGEITVMYSANPVTYQRSGTITAAGGGLIVTATVTQSQQPFALSITPSEKNIEDTEGSTTFTITTNTDWTINDDADWLNVLPESGSGNGEITVMYSANPVTYPRSGTITAAGGGLIVTATVTQSQQPFALSIIPSEKNVEDTEGSTTFTIITNTDWTINDFPEWLNVTPENGLGNETITVTYQSNSDTVQRIGLIILTGGGITDTIIIQQEAKKYLNISSLDVILPSCSGIYNFVINSNTHWELKKELDWLELNKYFGSNSDSLTILYSANQEIIDREGFITVYGSKDSCNILVRQNAMVFLSVSPDTQLVIADSGSVTININSNTSWNIHNSIDWIIVNPDSGKDTTSVVITFAANTDSLVRNGTIFFSADTLTTEFTLVQRGLETYLITLLTEPVDAGTTSGSGKYLAGANIKVTSFPSEGWLFKNWKEDTLIVSTDSVYNFIASYPRVLTAKFEKILDIYGENDLPERFELYQNYPNPFNPTTTIRYSIPELSFVELKIYDVLGNEIATLVNEEQTIGYYEIRFNAASLSSGIYFYRIRAGNFVQVKKILLMK